MNRPGLLLHNGILYAAFGSYADEGPYHGWVLAYDAKSLRQVGAFCTTPDTADSGQGGIWQSGMGLAADSDGYIYFATGNGAFNADTPNGRSYGDSVVKLRQDLRVSDYFTPCNQANLNGKELDGTDVDADLGSGGVMLVPYQYGRHAKLLIQCGKEGAIYVIDRNNMGRGKSAQQTPIRIAYVTTQYPPS